MSGGRGSFERTYDVTELLNLVLSHTNISHTHIAPVTASFATSPVERVNMRTTVDLGAPNFGPNIDLFVGVVLVFSGIHSHFGHGPGNNVWHLFEHAMYDLPAFITDGALHKLLIFGNSFACHVGRHPIVPLFVSLMQLTEFGHT